MNWKQRVDLPRLNRLARQFASREYVATFPFRAGEVLDLTWWRWALAAAVEQIQPNERGLLARALSAKSDSEVIDLWRSVARLPYEVVQDLIEAVHRQRGIWDLEDYLDGQAEEERST